MSHKAHVLCTASNLLMEEVQRSCTEFRLIGPPFSRNVLLMSLFIKISSSLTWNLDYNFALRQMKTRSCDSWSSSGHLITQWGRPPPKLHNN